MFRSLFPTPRPRVSSCAGISGFQSRHQYQQSRTTKKGSARNMSLPNSSLLTDARSEERKSGRPISVRPSRDGSTRFSSMFSSAQNQPRSSSIPPPLSQRHAHSDGISRSAFTRPPSRERPTETTSLDLMDVLHRSESSVVKTRSGSVLSRGMILKTDHYPSGKYVRPLHCNLSW